MDTTYLLGDGGSVLVTPVGYRDDAAREHGEGMLIQLADFEGIGLGVRPQSPRQPGDLVGSLSERSFAGNADQRGHTAEHRVRNPPVGGEIVPWQAGLIIQPSAGEKPLCDAFPFILQRAFHAGISFRADALNQKDFAPLTGYRRGTLANVETGRQNAPRVFWERCAQALGADVLLTRYDQIQAMATAHRQETARRVQAASDAMIRAWQTPGIVMPPATPCSSWRYPRRGKLARSTSGYRPSMAASRIT